MAFDHANAITDPDRRMDAMAACETQMMKAMPDDFRSFTILGLIWKPVSTRPEAESVRIAAVQVRLDRQQLEAAMTPDST